MKVAVIGGQSKKSRNSIIPCLRSRSPCRLPRSEPQAIIPGAAIIDAQERLPEPSRETRNQPKPTRTPSKGTYELVKK
jgi:hypothetical protein